MSRWKQGLLALPGVGVSLLPKLACPLCWPAYAGLLSSVGLGFLLSAAYLLPLTAGFLVIALGAMAFKANSRHGYVPFLLGIVAAAAVLLGKFRWESSPTKSHYVRCGRAVGYRLAVECVADSRSIQP